MMNRTNEVDILTNITNELNNKNLNEIKYIIRRLLNQHQWDARTNVFDEMGNNYRIIDCLASLAIDPVIDVLIERNIDFNSINPERKEDIIQITMNALSSLMYGKDGNDPQTLQIVTEYSSAINKMFIQGNATASHNHVQYVQEIPSITDTIKDLIMNQFNSQYSFNLNSTST